MAIASIRPGGEPSGRFVRDRLTLTLYSSYITWGWLLYSFSPSVTLLADEQGISKAAAGLHGTAMALGGLGAAFLAPRAVRRWDRRVTIIGSSVTVAVGVVALVLGPSLPWTLSAMFVVSVGGNVLLAGSQVGLALRHGAKASAAITEASGAGSSVGLVGPLAVGATVAVGWGWQPAVLVVALLALVTGALVARLPASPELTGDAAGHDRTAPRAPRRPTRAALFFLVALVGAVALENATTYWSTALLIERTGAGAGVATAATAGLVAGMSIIRFVVGPLSLRIDPAHLLAGGFVVAVLGWAVMWTTTSTGVALAGLFVAGLGYGVQYPLAIALLLAASPGRSDQAQGRATLAASLAVGVAPFLLGALADSFGMHAAFLVVPVLALAGVVASVLGGKAVRRAVSDAVDELVEDRRPGPAAA